MPINQADNLRPLRRFIRIEVEVDDLSDDLRENRGSGYDRRKNAASKII